MDGDDTPGGIGIGGNGLSNGLLVLSHVIVVGVEHDEQPVAIGVIVVAAGLGGAVIRGVGVIEVVGIVGVQGVMVADGGGNGERRQCLRG